MKKTDKISEGPNYSAITVGKLSDLGEHKFILAPGIEIPGKVFVGQDTRSTGTEVSFQIVPPAAGGDFLHIHNKNEELYITLQGSGEFQVDGTVFPISEGSIIRVSPSGKRAWRNTSNQPMIMLCVQSTEESLLATGISDGKIIHEELNW